MKRALPLLFTVLSFVSIAGCDDDDSNDNAYELDSKKQLLVGYWIGQPSEVSTHEGPGGIKHTDYIRPSDREFKENTVVVFEGSFGPREEGYALKAREGKVFLEYSSRKTAEIVSITQEELTLRTEEPVLMVDGSTSGITVTTLHFIKRK